MPSPITRRAFGASLAGALGLSKAARAQSKPPNILFLMADDVRGDSLGYMGHAVVKTPTLDSLARTGVAITRCFSPAQGGNPARVSALSGRYPHQHGVTTNDASLADPEILLPKMLAKHGYRTGMAGNFELTGQDMKQMFDSCATLSTDYQAYLAENVPDFQGGVDELAQKMESHGRVLWPTGASRLSAEHHPIGWTARKSIEFIEAAKEDEPWFLFSSVRSSDNGYVSPLPWPDRYPAREISLPVLPEERPTPPTALNRDSDYATKSHEASLTEVRAAYYGAISYLDEQINLIVRRLRSAGQMENTLIVFTAGRGDMLGELGRMGAGTPYDGVTRVPWMMHYDPGFKITGAVDRVADTTSLAPTILELAGLDLPEGFASPSAKEILTVVGANWEEAAFHEAGFHSVRTREWKLVEPRDHPTWEPQVFHLEKDPREETNLYGKPEAAEAQASLAARLQAWETA
jgi:choline-sulfatase